MIPTLLILISIACFVLATHVPQNLTWRGIAWICKQPRVYQWIVQRAQRTPYSEIMTRDNATLYMRRWWLFNRYDEARHRWWLPSVRIHHIVQPDSDEHQHSHPWNARTVILYGGYIEEEQSKHLRAMIPGDTDRLLYGQYHRIVEVLDGGAWAMFITWRYRGTWGFKVDGAKVPWREYLGQ